MSEREPPPPQNDLAARLARARATQERRGWRRKVRPKGSLGAALEVAIELVGALAVAVGIGWVLDDWLATGPLFLVIFFFLGAAAGGLNVYRRAREFAEGDETNDNGESGPGGAPGGRD